jgi:hypothetical protein
MQNTTLRVATFALAFLCFALAACDPSPDVTPSVQELQTEYSEAELAQRQAALDLYHEEVNINRWRADQPVTTLYFFDTMTEQQIRMVLEPFQNEIETIRFIKAPLTPEFLPYLTGMPRLKELTFHRMELVPSDFRGIDLRHVTTVKVDSEGWEPVKPWAIPDDTLQSTEWVTSDDGKLSIRLLVASSPIERRELLGFIIELRNNTDQALYITRPEAACHSMDIHGPRGPVKHLHLNPSPDTLALLAKPPSIILPPQDGYRQRIDLLEEEWPWIKWTGTYTIAHRYRSYTAGHVIAKVAEHHDMDAGSVEGWSGDVKSLPITIERK